MIARHEAGRATTRDRPDHGRAGLSGQGDHEGSPRPWTNGLERAGRPRGIAHTHQLKRRPAPDPKVDRKGQPYYTRHHPRYTVDAQHRPVERRVALEVNLERGHSATCLRWCAWATTRDRPDHGRTGLNSNFMISFP